MINEDYQGVYVLMERIKRDNDRVDIATLQPEDLESDQLTGGYIVRIDKGPNDGWESKYNAYNSDYKIFYQYYYPGEFDIQPQQKAYISGYFDDFEDAIASPTFENNQGKHYLEYIDLRSFVDNFLLNELSKNVDAYRLSTYFHKNRDSKGGKIKAGPLWDFNLAFANGDYCGGDDITGWEYYQCVGSSPFWWDVMLQDEGFKNALRCRWDQLRQTTLHTDSINTYLDSMAMYLSEAQDRNFQRWPTLGIYVWPNSWFYAQATSHIEILGHMKKWIADRSLWLDENIPGVAFECQLYESPVTGHITSIRDTGVVKNYVRVYPNPVKDAIHIDSNSIIREVSISNVTGQLVLKKMPNSNSIQIDIHPVLQKGVYLVSIKTVSKVETRKILID